MKLGFETVRSINLNLVEFYFLHLVNKLPQVRSFAMAQLKQVSSNKCFGGYQKVFTHQSKELACEMNFAIFLPGDDANQKYPVLYFLSGLTCNELNCVQKSGFQRYAAEHGIIVVCPDTSPRNIEGLDDSAFSWDFGYGAGFYVDATQDAYKNNFRMFSYVTSELIEVINSNFAGEFFSLFSKVKIN